MLNCYCELVTLAELPLVNFAVFFVPATRSIVMSRHLLTQRPDTSLASHPSHLATPTRGFDTNAAGHAPGAAHSFRSIAVFPAAIQREADEEKLQMKADPSAAIQREAEGAEQEEEEIQMKADLSGPIQREAEESEQEGEEMQMKSSDPLSAHPDVPVASGGGSAMPEPVQSKMEQSFGHSFDNVRIHEGPEAKQVGALAYTRGADIHFQPGQYSPESRSGQELLGHELAHVVQQSAGRVSAPQNKADGSAPINADPGLEAEADQQGARAARGEPASVSGASGVSAPMTV
jgi:hypothetical protein